MYTLARQTRAPLPQFSEDDVLDYMVKEAVMLRGVDAENEAAAKQRREDWKKKGVGGGM